MEVAGGAEPIATVTGFDVSYAVRMLADLVPNGFVPNGFAAFALVAPQLLGRLSAAFTIDAASGEALPLPVEPFSFKAALVVFGNVKAELPALIRAD